MKKYIVIAVAVAAGGAICGFAPQAWQIVGVFCIGGGIYAVTQILTQRRIDEEIARYECPQVGEPAEHREPLITFPRPGLNANFRFAAHGEPMVKAAA